MRTMNYDTESIMKWFNDVMREGENAIIIYPNVQTFNQIYTQYVKDELAIEADEPNNNSGSNIRAEKSSPEIILIATFYDTVNSVKHNLSAVGVDVQRQIDNGSLVIVDAFNSYFPDISGMKKLVASLSKRARKEGRVGVTAIVNMGFFFLYGGDGYATDLINYEASLPPRTEDGNVRGFSCYHAGDYKNLNDSQKKELNAQGEKKLLEVAEIAS